MRYKVHGVEADWLEEGGQEDDWPRAMMTPLSLTARKSGSDGLQVHSSQHVGKQIND